MAKRRRDESPERQALREMIGGYLKENPVKDGKDINAMMRDMMCFSYKSFYMNPP